MSGKGVEQLRNNPNLRRNESSPRSGEKPATEAASETKETESMLSPAANAGPDSDPIEAKIARNRPVAKQLQGELRAINTLGPWAGGSLLCQLKVPAMATIDRELWLQQGVNGASRPGDVDVKVAQRQSLGAGV